MKLNFKGKNQITTLCDFSTETLKDSHLATILKLS